MQLVYDKISLITYVHVLLDQVCGVNYNYRSTVASIIPIVAIILTNKNYNIRGKIVYLWWLCYGWRMFTAKIASTVVLLVEGLKLPNFNQMFWNNKDYPIPYLFCPLVLKYILRLKCGVLQRKHFSKKYV